MIDLSLSKPGVAALALAAASALLGNPAWASGSSASSASSEGSSASVGSISSSFEASSNSSSQGTSVAEGDYRVIEVATSAARPEALRLKLQAVPGSGAEGEFFLHLPRATLERHAITAGQVLGARTRPYGVEFALGTPREPFFLLMDDAWYRELRTTVVRI